MEHAIIFKFCGNMNWILTRMEKDFMKMLGRHGN